MVDRPDPLPDEDPGGVEALEQRRAERVLGARGVRVQRAQARDDAVHVGGPQRVAVPERVLLQRDAAQPERAPVERQAPAAPAELAQPHARPVAALPGHGQRQRVQRGARRLPQPHPGQPHARAHPGRPARSQPNGGEGQRHTGQTAAHPHDAGPAAIAHAHGHRDVGAAPGPARHHARSVELARPEPPDRHLAREPAVVEPRPVPALRAHPQRAAPIGAHDQPVAPRTEVLAHLERQVGAGVARHEPPVEPDLRAVVDGLEADRVVPRRGQVERRREAGRRALERGHRDPPRVDGERRPHAPAALRPGGQRAPARRAAERHRRRADAAQIGHARRRMAPRARGAGQHAQAGDDRQRTHDETTDHRHRMTRPRAPLTPWVARRMPTNDIDEQLDKYLADAHSIEEQALIQMRLAPRMAGSEPLASAFREHLAETERHERLVRERMQARGASPVAVQGPGDEGRRRGLCAVCQVPARHPGQARRARLLLRAPRARVLRAADARRQARGRPADGRAGRARSATRSTRWPSAWPGPSTSR